MTTTPKSGRECAAKWICTKPTSSASIVIGSPVSFAEVFSFLNSPTQVVESVCLPRAQAERESGSGN